MSDANLASLAVRKSGTHNFKALRYTGEDLKFNKETAQSQEIRSDGQVPDLAHVGGQPEGGYEYELSFLAQQFLLAAALRNEWQTINITASTTLTASTQTATAAAATFSAVPIGALVKITGAANPANNGLKRVLNKAGDGTTLVFIAGSIAADAGAAALTFTGKTLVNSQVKHENDFEKRIVNSQGEDYFLRYTNLVLDQLELNIESKKIVTGSAKFIGQDYNVGDSGDDPQATDGAKATGVLTFTGQPADGDTVTIGETIYTFRAAPDDLGEIEIGAALADTLVNFADAINGEDGVNDIHPLVIATAGATTLTVTAQGFGAAGNSIVTTEASSAASWGGGTLTGGVTSFDGYEDTDPGDVMNGTSNMGTILMDGTAATDRFKTIKLTIKNNARGKDALSYNGNFDVGLGTIEVTGNFNAYFLNNTLPTKIREHTAFSLSFYLQDSAGNQLHFYMPCVKPANGDPAISGINTDVMIETNFQAILDRINNTGKTIIIDAISA